MEILNVVKNNSDIITIYGTQCYIKNTKKQHVKIQIFCLVICLSLLGALLFEIKTSEKKINELIIQTFYENNWDKI